MNGKGPPSLLCQPAEANF